MSTTRRGLNLAVIAGLLFACTDPTDAPILAPSHDAVFSATSSTTPTVSTAAPDHLPPTATYDVAINGTGFATGATARFELNGAVGPNVVVNSTRYVKSTQLVANVTVAANAKLTLYDVAILLRSGKKGIGTERFTVAKDPVYSVEVRPSSASVAVGTTFQLEARVRTGNAFTQPIVTDRLVTWTSSNTDVITVDATGLLTGVSAGSATITATSEGIIGTAPVTVTVPASIAPLASLTTGNETSCALNMSGAALCWGDGKVGQLGTGFLGASSSPVAVAGGLTFASISPGIYHGCGLASGGAAYCCGRNDQGALGDGTLTQRLSPTPVSGGLQFTVIRTGMHFSCGLSNGAAYCWGQGQFGVLGNGTKVVSSAPVPVSGAHTFTALVTGLFHACALDTSGAAWCWGDNRAFGLGDGTTTNSAVPLRVMGGLVFTALSAGEGSSCGLTPTGAAYCWGYNYYGQLGDGKSGSGTSRGAPAPVLGGLSFTALRSGNIHVCGITSGGSAYCWGDNTYGQLGDGTLVARLSPVAVSGGMSFSTISAGMWLTCGVSTNSVAYCWGHGHLGQIGNGVTGDRSVPTRVGGQP
jgi:alpha-tubulin suppressor-like RCC1 family protein